MKSLSLVSNAKLNLYLEILGKLPDRYHSLFTLFERISLSDQIKLRLLPDEEIRIVLSDSTFSLPLGPRNLAYQAASLLKREFGIRQGVEIQIRKHIPVSAGLGGGSSNAAAVLEGLNRLWRLNLKTEHLVTRARRLGADVPFFLYNCSFAFATCRGDEIKVLKLPAKFWHIIVVPRIKVRSALVYKKWDQKVGGKDWRAKAELTTLPLMVKILRLGLLKKDLLGLGNLLFNSLEPVTTAMYPVIKKVKTALYDSGVEAVLMSGSGPAVFGLVPSRKEAYVIARQLGSLGSWDVFVAMTV